MHNNLRIINRMGNCSGVCANSGVDPTIVNKKGNYDEEAKQIEEVFQVETKQGGSEHHINVKNEVPRYEISY